MRLSRYCASLLLALCLLLPAPALEARPASGSVSPAEAASLLEEYKNGLLFLDVRTAGEFRVGHAPGALHIPVSELHGRMNEVPEGKPMLILCRSGRRAAAAFEMLQKAGRSMENVWYLSGYTDYASGTPHFHE